MHQTLSNMISHTRTLAVEERGLSFYMNEGCHAEADREVDATFRAVRVVGSWMIMPPDGRGGVLVSTYPEPAGVCFAMRGLFRVRLVRGGGGRV